MKNAVFFLINYLRTTAFYDIFVRLIKNTSVDSAERCLGRTSAEVFREA